MFSLPYGRVCVDLLEKNLLTNPPPLVNNCQTFPNPSHYFVDIINGRPLRHVNIGSSGVRQEADGCCGWCLEMKLQGRGEGRGGIWNQERICERNNITRVIVLDQFIIGNSLYAPSVHVVMGVFRGVVLRVQTTPEIISEKTVYAFTCKIRKNLNFCVHFQ